MFKFLLQKSRVLLFSEMTPLVRLSRERTIEENDMPLLPDALTAIRVESADKQVVGKQPRDFFKGLVKANWPQLRVLVILKICAVAASLSVPVFLYQTLVNMADKSSHSVGWQTLAFAFLMVAANTLNLFPIIINYCKDQKVAEFDFDKPDFEKLLRNFK